MKNLANGRYGEQIWEDKIQKQNEVGVVFGVVGSLKKINAHTIKIMTLFDKEIRPLIKNRAKIIDLGVGPLARFSIEFAKRGYKVAGIDISETTLKYAKKYIDKNKVKVRLIKGDITELERINEKFDFVFCIATFFHIPPHLTGISLMKIKNLLKSRGWVYIEFGLINKKKFMDYLKSPLYWFGHYIKCLLGKGFRVNVSRFSLREIREMVEKSGLIIERRFEGSGFLLKKC